MIVVEVIIVIALWLVSGHAIEKVFSKAGFIHTPKFLFWLPALNLAFLLYLAFADWPATKEAV